MSTKEEIAAIYDRIKALCKDKAVSQKDLCESCGINPQSHKGRVTRKILPDASEAVKIATFLNTSVEYLVTGEEKNIYKEKYDKLLEKVDSFIENIKDLS